MSAYLLDTNICICLLKGRRPVLDALLVRPPSSIHISVISEAELRAGAARSKFPLKTRRALERFLRPITVIELTSADAMVYARVRARLENDGTPIGPMDTLIGAHALARRLTLVTNNEREFSRIRGLRLENWAK